MPESTVDDLWRRWKDESEADARDRLVLHYAPLVKFVAGRLRAGMPTSVEQADLVSEGVIGLIDAIGKFDPGRGFQFQTYAVPRIRGAIVDSLRSADWVPRSSRERFGVHARAAAALEHRLGRTPTTSEIAAEIGVSSAVVRRTRDELARTATVHLEPDEESAIESRHALGVEPADAGDLPPEFGDAVRALAERDQVVIALYYWEGFTLAEIGRVLGVGESRVSQLHTRAMTSLRKALGAAR